MSFDVFVQDLPAGIRSVDEIPDDFKPQPLGVSREQILTAIRRVAPEVSFATPDWGSIDGPDYSVEVNLGDDDPVDGFAFHIRGGDQGLFVVAEILESLGLRALAPGTASGLFTLDTAAPAFAAWRSYRARVLGS